MANTMKCEYCNGSGIADYCTFEGDYSVDYKADCNECDGSGEINTRKYFLDENE
jgi:DnaJ-class molecular chaperone